MVVSHSALSGETVNIPDAYVAQGFDFSGTKNFDAKTGYRSQSFLTVPMRNHENEVIGVLQLINAKDSESGAVVPFSSDDQQLSESLASQAAIALTNRHLIEQLEALFEGFIQLINTAIDDKSPYTGGHCERVPVLTMMLAEAVNRTTSGPLKDFSMTDKDRRELKIAGLLHDCGKITTPVHVVDKATKLHTLFDRIQQLDTRFEVLKRDAEIEMLRAIVASPAPLKEVSGDGGESNAVTPIRAEFITRIKQLDDDREFLRHCNIGGEAMSDEDQQRVRRIATYQWRDGDGKVSNFLSDDEIENLTIRAGTLTAAERQIINHHIEVTIKMLESLPWPRYLKNVPEYAGGHHERMDGKGYPRGLTREQMSVQARVMGIADIFEALTAKDRPYKRGKTLTESLTILGKFKLGGHIDPDLFDVFIREKVYLDYAKQFLAPEQIDDVDLSTIPGVNLDS
jgi:HD-GYP domain-containing protein (c-di-GMP phosphodiesterase class II)